MGRVQNICRLFARRDAPRSPRWSSARVLSLPGDRAVVWGGRGATAMPREAEWSLGVAAVFWVYYNKNIFKDAFGHHVHYRGALYKKDIQALRMGAGIRRHPCSGLENIHQCN